MKISPDDPRLTDYVLGELSAEDAAQVDRVSAHNPAIRLRIQELEQTMNWLAGSLGRSPEHKLLVSQRQAILRASKEPEADSKPVELKSARKPFKPWFTGVAAAAAVVFAAILISRLDDEGKAGIRFADEIALLPMPGPETGSGQAVPAAGGDIRREQTRQLDTRGGAFLQEVAKELEKIQLPEIGKLPKGTNLSDYSDREDLRLPILLGNASPAWVNRWIHEKNQLPPQDMVRVEEFVNSVRLQTGKSVDGLAVKVESMDCPWEAGSQLIAVQLQAVERDIEELEVSSIASRRMRRVLGSFSVRSDSQLPAFLPKERTTLIMMQYKQDDRGLGSIRVTRGENEDFLQVPDASASHSPEMKRAVAMAAFGLWLRGEIETADLDTAVQKATSDDGVALHPEILRTINKAKKLSERGR